MIGRMNREFHYYVIWYLADKAGFTADESSIIALSSQMVDDAKFPWSIEPVKPSSPAGVREHPTTSTPGTAADASPSKEIPPRSEVAFLTETTQNYVFWDRSIAREVYLPFHFVPGDPRVCASVRSDGKLEPLAVSPDSDNARTLLIEALGSGNLFRIGIALHAYADTWAHQNFTGTQDNFNMLEPDTRMASVTLAASMLPAVGHLQAGMTPDLPQTRWYDSRLKPAHAWIDNSSRFLDAARMIYRFLRTSRRTSFSDEVFVLDPLRELWASRNVSNHDALAIASDYVIYFGVPSYDPNSWTAAIGAKEYSTGNMLKTISTEGFSSKWRTSAFHRPVVRGVISASNYRGSAFEEWNRAVRAHRDAFNLLMHTKGIKIL